MSFLVSHAQGSSRRFTALTINKSDVKPNQEAESSFMSDTLPSVYWTRHCHRNDRHVRDYQDSGHRSVAHPSQIMPQRSLCPLSVFRGHHQGSWACSGRTLAVGSGGQRQCCPAGVWNTAGGRLFQCH